MTKEVERARWVEFCQQLTRDAKGSAISIRTLNPNGGEDTLARGEALESIEFAERNGECSDMLRVRAGRVDHTIVEPIYIRLRDSGSERMNRIDIQAESGGTIIELERGFAAAA